VSGGHFPQSLKKREGKTVMQKKLVHKLGALGVLSAVFLTSASHAGQSEPGGLWFLRVYSCAMGKTSTTVSIRESRPGERFCVNGNCNFEPGYVAENRIRGVLVNMPLTGWGASSITMKDEAGSVFRLNRIDFGKSMSGTAIIDGIGQPMSCVPWKIKRGYKVNQPMQIRPVQGVVP
jgi:hypothetical protein